MDEMLSSDESDAEPMTTDMLKYIRNVSQSHPSINRRDAPYTIQDCIKQRRAERKGPLSSTKNMGKGLYKVFRDAVNELSESLPIMEES